MARAHIPIVFRLRWIAARAGVDRSDEEIAVLHAEMRMIYKGYLHMAGKWAQRAETMARLGHSAHVQTAREKEEIWLEFAQRAKTDFNAVSPGSVR